jgi:hypothetical protein
LVDARLLRRSGIRGKARILELQIFSSLSGSLVDPGCICILNLAVLGCGGYSARQVRVQQRMSRATARRLSAIDSTVSVWIDHLDLERVAVDVDHGHLQC